MLNLLLLLLLFSSYWFNYPATKLILLRSQMQDVLINKCLAGKLAISMLCVVVQKSTECSKEPKLLSVGCFILFVQGP